MPNMESAEAVPAVTEKDADQVAKSTAEGREVATEAEEEADLDTDPYHYTKRGEFTSEVFKIAIQNLPKHYGYTVS